jgi:hypothetical protein
MKRLFASLLFAFAAGCSQVPQPQHQFAVLAGVYDGREVVDTEERLTLRPDGTFTYDFIPFGQTGESYVGRWRSEGAAVFLIAKMESGEDEVFPLSLAYERGVPVLTYTWASHRSQRATMLIPNAFVREKLPNQTPEPTTTLVTPRAGARVAPSVVVAHL